MIASTLDRALSVENVIDQLVYRAANGVTQIDPLVDEAARKLGITRDEVLNKVVQRNDPNGTNQYGPGIVGSIPESVLKDLHLDRTAE